MRFGTLRPEHGWRAFGTELVVVILGVLIALWAQQLVDRWRSRAAVADLRQSLNMELGQSLDAYRLRIAQGDCARRRLAELEGWLAAQHSGRPTKLTSPIDRPLGFALDTTAWEQAGDTLTNMPLKQRIAYGTIYSELRNYDLLRLQEKTVWIGIRGYEGAAAISPERQFDLHALITQARDIDRSIELNGQQDLPKEGVKLGVKLDTTDVPSHYWRDLCRPLQTKPA